MPIQSLAVDRFRNLESTQLTLSPQLNLFTGENAAGKTSILEALYLLARGRSFRTRHLDKLARDGEKGFRIVVRLMHPSGRVRTVGMEREGNRLICRIDGQPAKRLSELAALFPVQWLGGNLHALIDDAPAYRRQVLDWGLFHVKPAYMDVWKRFQKLIKQRNAALRQKRPNREVQVWDTDLADAGEQLHGYRQAYLDQLIPELQALYPAFPTLAHAVELNYRRGWRDDDTYADCLGDDLAKDRESGFTRSGPHRAELAFKYGGKPAREALSRGQQKVFIALLQVAQATLLHKQTHRSSLFLFDDLTAELDTANQQSVMSLLQSIDAQVFVTSIADTLPEHWPMQDIRRFHVKHGKVSEVV